MQEQLSQKWTICSLLEDVAEGIEFHFADSPLHITIAGVFAVDKTGQELADELEKVLAGRRSVEIEADQKAMYGPNEDIEVMKVVSTPELTDLYFAVHEWLSGIGAAYNSPEYQGDGFGPHVTVQKSGSLGPGEKRLITSLSLIDMFPHRDGYQRKVVKTIDLL